MDLDRFPLAGMDSSKGQKFPSNFAERLLPYLPRFANVVEFLRWERFRVNSRVARKAGIPSRTDIL